jgi:hypothetical protein
MGVCALGKLSQVSTNYRKLYVDTHISKKLSKLDLDRVVEFTLARLGILGVTKFLYEFLQTVLK